MTQKRDRSRCLQNGSSDLHLLFGSVLDRPSLKSCLLLLHGYVWIFKPQSGVTFTLFLPLHPLPTQLVDALSSPSFRSPWVSHWNAAAVTRSLWCDLLSRHLWLFSGCLQMQRSSIVFL
uniref:Uncharacterized protein n=1 Tax=Eutreptiella gymnastica TaxID=73025 RepID=A0A7S4G5C0_9EUGL